MLNLEQILQALQSDPSARRTAATGAAAGAAGLAAGMLMGRGERRMLGNVAKYGAVAALGGLAVHVLTGRRGAGSDAAAGAPSIPPPVAGADGPVDASAGEARMLARAMISAAKADGSIDADEKARIFARLEAMGADAETKAFVFDELSKPLDIEAVIADASTPERAVQIYAASLAALEVDSPAERAYLEMLSARLGVDPSLAADIRAQLQDERAEGGAPADLRSS